MEKSVVDLELVYGDSVRGTVRFAGNAQLENAVAADEVLDLDAAIASARTAAAFAPEYALAKDMPCRPSENR